MKKSLTMMTVLAVLVALPVTAFAQNGYYTWSISGSNTEPFQNVGPAPVGLSTLYLWFVEGCHPAGTGGMSAAEFKIVKPATWTFAAFTAMNGFFETGPAPDASGKNFLMAVGACPTGPVVAGSILLVGDGSEGRVGFTITDQIAGLSQVAATVDCAANPELHEFPAVMRCVGFASSGATPNQNDGQDCNVTPVESTTWGSVKGLYR